MPKTTEPEARDLRARSDSEEASHLLMEAADFFAATLAVADERSWQHLLIYCPSDLLRERMSQLEARGDT